MVYAIASFMESPEATKTQEQKRQNRCARVLFPVPVSQLYDYAIPEGFPLQPGDVVEAPLGQRRAIGVVWDIDEEPPHRALKPLRTKLFSGAFTGQMLRFIDWTAAYVCFPRGSVLRLAFKEAFVTGKEPQSLVYSSGQETPKRMTPARARVLACLSQAEERGETLTAQTLMQQAKVSHSVLKTLAEQGVVRREHRVIPEVWERPCLKRMSGGFDLTADQKKAVEALKSLGEGFQPVLLDGVTGSGKTEVYFEEAATILHRDPQAQILFLLPEIALTQAVTERIKRRFGVTPSVWHADLGQAARRRTWRAVAKGHAQLVVGARSALFLPYRNLRLIVVDEEHDPSYKQEERVTYQARDLAMMRAKMEHARIILASATPSLESFKNALNGRYTHIRLSSRPGQAVLPPTCLIDLREERLGRETWLSAPLLEAIRESLERGEQALLFLNRRGYAPLVICSACGHRLKAPDTDSWLAEHRLKGRVICHRTGFSMPLPKACPHCGQEGSLKGAGPGVERLAEEACLAFPDARFELLSSDTAGSASVLREKLTRIARGDVDIIIGTQILAKGHNFPHLTLVGVVDADLGLKGGDFRAGERTCQILTQVAGRAGRKDKPGRALIQTYNPEHTALRALAEGNRDAFFRAELEEREVLGLPPSGRLASLTLYGRHEKKLITAARHMARLAPLSEGVDVMGPAEPSMAMVRGYWRRRFMIRADKNINVSAYVEAWRSRLPKTPSLRLTINIDPYGFL